MGVIDFFRRPTPPVAMVAAPGAEPGIYAPSPRESRSAQRWWGRADVILGDDGVGFARWFCNLLAEKVAAVTPVIEHQLPSGDWTKDGVDDPIANQVIQRLTGHQMSRQKLIEAMAYHRQTLGQYRLVRHDPLTWSAHSVTACVYMGQEGQRDGKWRITLGDVELMDVEAWRTWRCWNPDKRRPYEATSPVRNALTDLELCLLFQRFMTRGAESGMVMRQIMWIAKEAMGTKLPDAQKGGPQYALERDFYKLANQAWQSDGGLGAVAPWLLSTSDAFDKPSMLEVPFPLRDEVLKAEQHCLEKAARSLNAPQQLIVNQGGSSHWNEWQIDEKEWEQGPKPIADAIFHEDLTTLALRPMLHALRARGYRYDPEKVRVGYDPSKVLTSPDQSSIALELRDRGLLKAEPVVRACGFDVADMTSDAERFELMRQSHALRSQPRGPIDPHTRTSTSRLRGQPARQGALALAPYPDEETEWLD
ncbi:MAG: hypothetical protein EKK65_08300 [Lysobacterales bacterium]|nr:MAG: hypothetical protein EKK65_08300 [Xanthomonadales bacterium]